MEQKIADRIRLVRESQNKNGKKMSQEAFAERLGVTRSVIKNLEYDKVEPQKPILTSICTVFGVNYEWLRTGEGDMFIQPETFSLDKYVEEHNLTPLDMDIIREYISMDQEFRDAVMEKIRRIVKKHKDYFTG